MSAGFLSPSELLFGGPTGLCHAAERALWHLGFVDVRVVDGANDDGADLLAVRDGHRWVFHCRWSRHGLVDRDAIDAVERGFARYQASKGVLVTNTGIDRRAEERRAVLQTVGLKITVWDAPTLGAIWRQMPDRVPNRYESRVYQSDAITSIERDLNARGTALLILATALGKTVVGGEVIGRRVAAKPGTTVLVTAHTKELVEQLERAMWKHVDKRTPTSFVTGDVKARATDGVIVATVESALGLVRAGLKPGFIMIDETHHVAEQGMLAELLDRCPNALQLGLTATPWRGDKFDITNRFGMPSFSMGIAEGMVAGYLSVVDYRIFVDNLDWTVIRQASRHGYSIRELNRMLFLPQRDEEIIEQLRAAWRHISEPRAIVFCQTIEHAEHIAMLMSTSDHAWRRAAFLHSGVARQHRQALLNEFRSGRVPVITCVDVFNEGVDVPDVNLIAFLRVTHSRRIFVQQLGRGLRVSPKKKSLQVLDFVSDIRRVAATLDLQRALEAEAEYLRVPIPEGGGIRFSDNSAGSLLEHWIKDAADLETAADDVRLQLPPYEGSSMRMAMSPEVETKIVQRLFEEAEAADWLNLPTSRRTEMYYRWVDSSEVGNWLGRFMSPEQARVWIKDGPMKEFSRAIYGVGKYATLVSKPALSLDNLLRRVLGEGWEADADTLQIKPLRVVAGRDEERVRFTWGTEAQLKHLVWAAVTAAVKGDDLEWVLCLVDSFEKPIPPDRKKLNLRIGHRCGLRVEHVSA